MTTTSTLLRTTFLSAAAAAGAMALGAVSVAQAGTINVLSANELTCGLYGSHVAEDLGIYSDGGLEVNMLNSETTVPAIAFLSNGDAELVMLDSAQVYQMSNADQPGVIIYEVMQFAPEAIYVLADSPVTGIADLKGETVGLASDRDQITLIIALDSIGMDISDVTTVVVGEAGPVMATSLSSKSIAAFSGSSSDLAGIEAAGVHTRNITPLAVSQNVGNSYGAWVPRLEEIRPDVSLFLKGLAMGTHAGILDEKTTAAICRKRIPEEWEIESTGWNLLRFAAGQLSMRRTKDYGELQRDVWANVQAPYIKLGEIDGFIDPNVFINDSFVAAANAWTTDELKRRLAAWKDANSSILFD